MPSSNRPLGSVQLDNIMSEIEGRLGISSGITPDEPTRLLFSSLPPNTELAITYECSNCHWRNERIYTAQYWLSDRQTYACNNCGADSPTVAMRTRNEGIPVVYREIGVFSCRRCSTTNPSARYDQYTLPDGNTDIYCRPCIAILRSEELIHGHAWVPSEYRHTIGKFERDDAGSERVTNQNSINPLFYGTELEINTTGDITRHATAFKKWLIAHDMASYFYFKKDGSISNGYEIVTHPMTAKARHEKVDWKAICTYLIATGASSEESGECGLHIHASRDTLRNRDIGKLKYFFWANRAQIHRLSRRVNYRYCQLEKYEVRANRWGHKGQYMSHYPDAVNRYTAINTHTSKPTIEFRFMRGTLDYERLLASFQLVDSLISFVKNHSCMSQDTTYSWQTFKLWLRETNRYWHLERYLDKEKV